MNTDAVTRRKLLRQPANVAPQSDSALQTERLLLGAERDFVAAGSAPGSSSHPGSSSLTQDRRAQLESGLILWARLNALIVMGISILITVIRVSLGDVRDDQPLPWAPQLALSTLFLSAGFGLVRLHLRTRQLVLADFALNIASGIGFAWMVSDLADVPLGDRHWVFELTSAHLLMLRAGVVPSSGPRTVWVGTLTFAPGLLLYVAGQMHQGLPLVSDVLQMTSRCAATLVASALASRRIYGLRKQVAQSRQLGQYTLQERVGRGGMGVVFKAKHALLRRPTAIKLLLPSEVEEHALAQFEREAQLTSQLTHPSTIQIFDFGRNESGVLYYAMEYLDGLTLYDLVSLTGPLQPSRTIALLVQVCGSLAEAHAVGLVHRDVKPANIMVCERGRVADVVKVLDFGLAKTRGQPAQTLSSILGSIAGTPGFMSPESIVQPDSVDARSDIYAVGAVAYYLLTTQELFSGRTNLEVLLDQVNTAPVPIPVRRGSPIPADLEQVVMSCLSKDPGQRPQTADELSERLLACKAGNGWTPARARTWWERHREHVVTARARSTGASLVPSPAP